MPDAAVAVILLTYNQREDTLTTLGSLRNAAYPGCRVVLVDNASTDGTAEGVARDYPDTDLVRVETNLGCAGGRNVGLRRALQTDAEYLFFLDNDCFLEPETIPALVEAAGRHPQVGLFTGKMLFWKDPDRLWGTGGLIDWRTGRTPTRGSGEIDRGQYDDQLAIDFASGGYCFVSAAVARELGDIWEDYFIYYEDPDWCVKARRLGYTCEYVPGARVWHNPGQSVGGSAAFYYYRARNRPLFMGRNAPTRYRAAFWPHYWRDASGTYYMLVRSGERTQARGLVQGVMAYFRRQWGAYPG